MELGAVLRAARQDAGLSQSEVARRAGITPQSLSRWEVGTRPVRADDADRVLVACGRDARFTIVLRHARLDEHLAEQARRSVEARMQIIPAFLGMHTLHQLQATGFVRFGKAWAAAALGLPPLHQVGGVLVSADPAEQARVVAAFGSWPPNLLEDGRQFAATWDDKALVRSPSATWITPLLGAFRIDVAPAGAERVLQTEQGPWRVVDPTALVPDDVDPEVLERWQRLVT